MAEEPKHKSGGLSIQTLLVSAAAAVAAATVVPMIWEQGTILATAMTPVIVALVSEGLRKPVQTVSAVAPRVARRSGTGAAVRRFEPAAAAGARDPERAGARGEGVGGDGVFDPLPPDRRDAAPALREDDPFGLRAARRPRPRLKIALITGALAFVIAAGVVTASELALFGGSVSSDRRTSLFGGKEKQASSDSPDEAKPEATPTATPQEDATPAPTPSETTAPADTPTPAPAETATPPPAQASPTPAPTP